jgi:hypothetical protein
LFGGRGAGAGTGGGRWNVPLGTIGPKPLTSGKLMSMAMSSGLTEPALYYYYYMYLNLKKKKKKGHSLGIRC